MGRRRLQGRPGRPRLRAPACVRQAS